ncbi:S41 family peptidase [Sphingobacterium sp.]|uniref:S41 family peptidase n=1 Tax=Sphingobacterium sp. TaxID=341027 RepID=UPI0031E24838
MQRRIVFFLLIFTSLFTRSYAQVSTVSRAANAFLDTVQRHAYRISLIKWDSIRPLFLEQTRTIADINGLEPYFKKILRQLKDKHSKLFFEKVENNKEAEQALFEKMAVMTDNEAGFPPKIFSHYMTKDQYAYIRIPGVFYEQRKFVDTVGAQLKVLDTKHPKAWIIDLTENDGGSIFPMIWQFVSLLDVDETYSLVDREGIEVRERARLKNLSGEELKMAQLFGLDPDKVPTISVRNKDIPIVLLVSELTSSAGEFFVAHFKGQKNVTVLGQTTSGQTSGNSQFPIGNNYMVNLTTDVLKDRSGKLYEIKEGIQPDVSFEIDFPSLLGVKKIETFDQLSQAIRNANPIYMQHAISYLKQNLK